MNTENSFQRASVSSCAGTVAVSLSTIGEYGIGPSTEANITGEKSRSRVTISERSPRYTLRTDNGAVVKSSYREMSVITRRVVILLDQCSVALRGNF